MFEHFKVFVPLHCLFRRYAGVLTEEEATRITRDKLIRLQSLYIEQFKWLQHTLSERRRKYLIAKAQLMSDNPGWFSSLLHICN